MSTRVARGESKPGKETIQRAKWEREKLRQREGARKEKVSGQGAEVVKVVIPEVKYCMQQSRNSSIDPEK